VSPLKRTWAPRGETPTIWTSVEHNERFNLIGGLCLTPGARKLKLYVRSYWDTVTGEQVVDFLEHLLAHVPGPIVLLWDKHPIHKRKVVKAFLSRHPRVMVEWFPTAAPELNPTEGVWAQVSEYTASTAPHSKAELQRNVMAGLARTRRSQRRLWACILGSELPWRRRRGH
jgi:putative transposase